MKIYFCDLCDQSIPLSDITEGRATTVKGKVLCTQCVPKPGPSEISAPPSQPVSAREFDESKRAPGSPHVSFSPALLALSLVTFVLALGAAALAGFAYARLRDLEGEGVTDRTALKSRVDRLVEDLNGFQDDVTQAKDGVSTAARRDETQALATKVGEILKRLDDAGDRWTRANEEAARRQSDHERDVAKRVDDLEGRQRVLADKLEADSRTLFGRVGDIEKSLLPGSNPGMARVEPDVPPARGGDPKPVVSEELPPAVKEQLDKLVEGDISERWVALTELTKLRDARAVPTVVKYLKDEDPFVRHAAAQFLGEVEARGVVGELVEALSDDEAFVRDGVYLALQKITRQNLKFDAHAPPEQRKKAREKWSEWWKANQSKFLEESH